MLATSYRVNDASTVYDFTLRQGVRFHNGQLLTPNDVVYTFTRLRAEGIPYAQNRFPTLQSVSALTARSVRFTLSRPDPGFLLNMGDPFTVGCAILSRTAGPSTNLALKMVGTGPFAMVSYAPTREIQLKRFERYWGTKAKLSKLRVAYTPEASAQLVALLAGKADLIFPDPSLIRPLQSASKIVKIGSVIAATTLRVEMSAARVPIATSTFAARSSWRSTSPPQSEERTSATALLRLISRGDMPGRHPSARTPTPGSTTWQRRRGC